MSVTIDDHLDRVNWTELKERLVADGFDNGRSPTALQKSFENSQFVAFAWYDDRLVGMARLLSDGVCAAYLLDVWTSSACRRMGIGSALMTYLAERVPGQEIGLNTEDAHRFYLKLGFFPRPMFMAKVIGDFLDNDANRS
ncbi:MAG TPA: GNAT family N-acetyltransferase [Acidimicrobiales bacterium]|jgi:GNAT superfamily N-acetyltransferase|nr:GNAT family N-acetyltransferase [Acidimicrobiales bacterium]